MPVLNDLKILLHSRFQLSFFSIILFTLFPILSSSHLSIIPDAWSSTYYVDATIGKNTNPGSQDLPFETISAAAIKAFAGDTILISSGIYRETINLTRSGSDLQNPITISAKPDADVNIKGSDLVTGWIMHSASIWKKPSWSVNSQQVFINGAPLKQIGKNCPFNSISFANKPILSNVGEGLADMTTGSFWYDSNSQTLYISPFDNSNPNSQQIEVSVRNWVIRPGDMLKFINLNNLKFYHSNHTANGLSMGIVNVWGQSWLVSGCTFNYGDFAGINIIGEGHKIINNKASYNGSCGIYMMCSDAAHLWKAYSDRPAQNILLKGNETSNNNYRGFNYRWHAGGVKAIPSCNGVTVDQHKANFNIGPGIWFDVFCKNITIERSEVRGNIAAGIFYEISDNAVIRSNLVEKNLEQGIYISAADNVTVCNNTLTGNGAGIVVHGMPRADHPTLQYNKIRNNILHNSQLVDLVLYNNSSITVSNTSDYNLFSQSDGVPRISWTNNSGYAVNYRDLNSFSAISGHEMHSLFSNPLWVSPALGNFGLTAGSPAIDRGIGLPEAGEFDFLGNPRFVDYNNNGTALIDIGAYELTGISDKKILPPRNFRMLK